VAHHRKHFAVVSCWVLLVSFCFGAQKDNANLKSLYDNHRWFELRDAAVKGAAPIFYQGIVACVFDRLDACKKDLDIVFSSAPKSDEALEGHRTLAFAYRRHGKYREALGQVDALLAVRPKDSDAANDQVLLRELANSPDQHIDLRHSMVKLQEALPFSINGVKAAYWFDTGAESSVMTESEAKRFRVSVHDVAYKLGDVNGTLFKTRIAVVDEMSIGDVRLKHVAFLVLSDHQPPFNEVGAGSRGVIGIPVLLALERFSWSADKKFEIDAKAEGKSVPHADLCFDGNHPVVQIQYEGRSLMFPLDTGATSTDLYPPFAAAFPELIRTAGKTSAYKMEGIGGAKSMEAATLSSLHFSIGGFPVVLKSTGVLLYSTTDASRFFAGNLGIDLLQEAHTTTFDFKAMALTLQ
jgi:hypothetical protein